MSRLIDADALIRDMEENPPSYGDMDRVIAAVNNAPTVGKEMAEALDCFRRVYVPHGIVCEQKKCKWRCEGRNVGLDHGYCAANNLMGDIVRLLGGEPGKEVILRVSPDRC